MLARKVEARPPRRPRAPRPGARRPRRADRPSRESTAHRSPGRPPQPRGPLKGPAPSMIRSGRIAKSSFAPACGRRSRFDIPKKRAAAPDTGRSNSLPGVTVLDDSALEHQRNRLAQLGGLGAVVGDDDRGQAALTLGLDDHPSSGPRAGSGRAPRAARRASSSSGSAQSARASATRCCSPPERPPTRLSAKPPRPDLTETLARDLATPGATDTGGAQRQGDVVGDARGSAAGAAPGRPSRPGGGEPACRACEDAAEDDRARRSRLETGDRAQQGRLAGARRPDQCRPLTRLDSQVDAPQDRGQPGRATTRSRRSRSVELTAGSAAAARRATSASTHGARNRSASAAATCGSVWTNGSITIGSVGRPATDRQRGAVLAERDQEAEQRGGGQRRAHRRHRHPAQPAPGRGARRARHLLQRLKLAAEPGEQDQDRVGERERYVRQDQAEQAAVDSKSDEPLGQAEAGEVGRHQQTVSRSEEARGGSAQGGAG